MNNFYRNLLGDDQRRIYNRLVNKENVFITGNAGTGKSFLVEAFNEYCEENDINLLKAAPTGVAACNIKGMTLHKMFGLKTDVKSMLKHEVELPVDVEKLLNLASVILIDEISMVRLDVFDKIMNYIQIANNIRNQKKRSNIQIVLVGDFYQLPPVVTEEDKRMLDLHYGRDVGNAFAFQSTYWNSLCIQFEKLTEVRRQDGDKPFCTALDKCKEGDSSCMPFFALEACKSEIQDAIWLCGRNDTAADLNKRKLDAINSPASTFKAEYRGEVTKADKLCEDELVCKVGARVLMLINESSGLYQNGSMGTIVGYDYNETDECDIILVAIDRKSDDGTALDPVVVEVEPQEFSKYEYQPKTKTEEYEDERGTKKTRVITELILAQIGYARQFPMKLGFAITIHKAQGQTYEAMNFKPEIFSDGQLYVALSRCRFVNTMYIATPLSAKMFRTAQEVVNYYHNPENYSFFGHENDKVTIQVKASSENACKLLDSLYADNKEVIFNFLMGLKINADNSKTVKDMLAVEKNAIEAVAPAQIANDEYEQTTLFDLEETSEKCDNDEEKMPPAWGSDFVEQSAVIQNVDFETPDNYIALAVQTTGFDNITDRVISINALRVENSHVVSAYNALVNPHKSISRQTETVTGINNLMLANAQEEDAALSEFLEFRKGISCVVGHRTQVDVSFLEAIGRRVHIPFNEQPMFDNLVDVYYVSRDIMPNQKSRDIPHLLAALELDAENTAYHENKAIAILDIYKRLLDEARNTGVQLRLIS